MYDMQICLFSQPDLAVHKCADTQQYVGLTDLDPTLNNINNISQSWHPMRCSSFSTAITYIRSKQHTTL